MNLKLLSTALPLFLLPLFTAGVAQAEILSVKTASANFREAPNDKATVKYTADKFYPVEVLEKKAGWMKVKDFEGDIAWVSSKMLESQASLVIQVERANMRSNPTLTAPVVFKVERGEVFKIEKREGPWLKVVDARGDGGWIRDDMTWGEPEAEKAETEAKPEGAITSETKAEGAKESPDAKSEKATEPTVEPKPEPKAEPKVEPGAPLQSTLSSEPNLEALCRAFVAQAEEKKSPAQKPVAASPKAQEKKKKDASKPKPAKPADKKSDKKPGDKPKK